MRPATCTSVSVSPEEVVVRQDYPARRLVVAHRRIGPLHTWMLAFCLAWCFPPWLGSVVDGLGGLRKSLTSACSGHRPVPLQGDRTQAPLARAELRARPTALAALTRLSTLLPLKQPAGRRRIVPTA